MGGMSHRLRCLAGALLLAFAGCPAQMPAAAPGCAEPAGAQADAGTPPLLAAPVPSACLDALPKLVDESGAVDPAVYDRLAPRLGRAEGIALRFGPDARCVQGGPPTAPLAWAAPHRHCGNGNPGFGEGYTFEVGGPCNDDAAYGSTQGPVLFDADRQENDGVDWIQYMS